MSAVEQRLSVVTLGVRDLPRARSVYTSLGWVTRAGREDDVVFSQAGGLVVASGTVSALPPTAEWRTAAGGAA